MVRDRIKSHVVYKVGDRCDIDFRQDNWNSLGPLMQCISHRDLYDARISGSAKLKYMVSNGKWKWPDEWFNKFPIITSIEDPDISN